MKLEVQTTVDKQTQLTMTFSAEAQTSVAKYNLAKWDL